MDGQQVPVLLWAPLHEVESEALTQLRNTANLPSARYVRAMPDVHAGFGVPVGSVVALKDAVAPGIVGVDIGCGMDALRTSLTPAMLPKDLKGLRLRIEEFIPNGTGCAHETAHPGTKAPEFEELWERVKQTRQSRCSLENAKRQMGTLGSGNHFIEVCEDQEGRIWLMLHSGSRNFGKEVADSYAHLAEEHPINRDLPDKRIAVFPRESPDFADYWRDMQTAQEYARLNRQLMMDLLLSALHAEGLDYAPVDMRVSCHHNYATEEVIDGEKLIVARKGAIEAKEGQWGIIPGAMGRKSFIVQGLGNPESLMSASHGAGRKMSRSKANKTFTLDDLRESTKGVECHIGKGVLDEIAMAYKDIEVVMQNQADLVTPMFELHSLLTVKGHDEKMRRDRKESEKAWKNQRRLEREMKHRVRE
jgi:tRNA-splicing ligase RtcB